jgi:hypothetical protein
MTYTLTRRTEPFPENDSDIDATKVTTNISNAEEIMNKYIVLWVFQADSHGEGGPVAFAFDSVNSLGQGVVKTFIQNEFFATDTLNTLIIGMDFDPAKGLNENTMQDATYIGVVNWDGVSNPWENSIVKIEKDKSAELTLDTFVPAEEFHWFGYARPPMETAMIPFAVWSLFSASS